MRTSRRACFLAAAVAFAVALLASSTHAQFIQKVAVTGDAAPGPAGSVFEYILTPSVPPPPPGAADGPFSLFVSSTRGAVGDLRDYGVFGGLTGQLQPLFVSNGPAPGTAGAVFAKDVVAMTKSVVVNDAGLAAMFGFLAGGDTVAGQNDIGIWTGKPGQLQLFARAGQLVPSAEGDERFINFDPPGIGNAGQIVFRADTNLRLRIYAGSSPSNLRRVFSSGDPAPFAIPNGGEHPVRVSIPGFRPHGYTTKINGAGQVAFAGSIFGFVVASDERGIFYSGSSGVEALAHTAQNRFGTNPPLTPGSEAPGTGNRGHFTRTGNFDINEAGQVAFESEYRTEHPFTSGNGLWIGTPGNLQLIVRTGQDSGVDGATFGAISVPADGGFVNYSGEVVFHAFFGSASRRGIFRASGGLVTPVAFTGLSAADEAGAGWTFDTFGDATINDAGEVAFTAFLKNGSQVVQKSLWLANSRNQLRLVARVGA